MNESNNLYEETSDKVWEGRKMNVSAGWKM